MRRIIITALLGLATFGGVASADRPRGRDNGGVRVQRDNGGVRVQRAQPRQTPRPGRTHAQPRHVYQNRVRVEPRHRVRAHHHVVRRPIYVQAPVIRYRYYNYYQRPALLVENRAPIAGYIWVPGQWYWNGYEWLWQPGYYQPDPAYNQYGYPSGYDYY